MNRAIGLTLLLHCQLLRAFQLNQSDRPILSLIGRSTDFDFADTETAELVKAANEHSFSSAIQLAIEHFNNRNDVVVAELADLRECGVVFPAIQLSLNEGLTVEAIDKLWDAQAKEAVAAVGPIQSDIFDIAVPATQATGILLVDHYFGTHESIVTTTISVHEEAVAMISYMKQEGIPWSRLAIVCSGRSCERLPAALQDVGERDVFIDVSLNQYSTVEELGYTIENVKKSGARAVYIDVTSWDDLLAIAETMHNYDVTGDDLLIILPPHFVQSFHPDAFTGEFEVQDGMNDFLKGSLVFSRLDGFQYRIKDKFVESWRSRFRAKADDYPTVGASFVYDTVLAIGMGLCDSTASSLSSGLEFLNFRGASGLVRFELNDSGIPRRRTDDFLIGAFNIRQNAASKTLELVRTSTYSKLASWRKLEGVKFVYRSGSTFAPFIAEISEDNLRTKEWALSLGILSVNIVLLIATATIALLWYFRKEPVVRRSQPIYQCLICIGCMITISTTATLSHYSSYTPFFHDGLCTVLPWTFVVGQVVINSAEFAKLWRVNQVTSLIRIKQTDGVSLSAVPPLLSFIPLMFWTALDRMTWAPRSMIEGAEHCTSNHFLVYASVCGLFVVTGVVMTLVYAGKSKRHGVPEDFQDGKYIARAASIQAQTLAWACLAYLVGLDDHGSLTSIYLWRISVVAVLALSPMLLIIFPTLYRAAFERGLGAKIEMQLSAKNMTQRDVTTEHQSSTNLVGVTPTPVVEEPSLNSLFDPSIDESTIDSYFA